MPDSARVHRKWSSVGWGVLTVGGLLVALIATSGPPGAPVTGAPPVRVVIELPDPLKATVFGLFVLTTLLLFVLLVPRIPRRRRKADDEWELVIEHPKVSPWMVCALLALGLLPVALGGYLLWHEWPTLAPSVAASRPPVTLPRGSSPPPQTPGRPEAYLPAFSGAVGFLALAVALGCLGLTLWIFFEGRTGWGSSPSSESRAPTRLMDAIEESLDNLRLEPDPRRAIIRCYRRFEHVVAHWGLPRAPWQTPTEFMRKALGRLPVPATAVRRLTEAFEISRFSHHPVGAADRETALGALIEIKTALEEPDPHDTAS